MQNIPGNIIRTTLVSNMKTRNTNKRSSFRAVSPESGVSPEKLRRVSARQKFESQTTNSMKNDSSLLCAVSPETDELPEKLRRVSPRQKVKGQTRNSMKNDGSLLHAVSPESEELVEKIRVSRRQKVEGQTAKSMKNDSSLLRAVSPETDESPEKLRRVSPRQKGQTTNSMKNDSSLLLAASPERDKSPEKLRGMSLRQKGKGQTTNSMKNDSSLLHAVSPERDKSPEKLRRVSPRQQGKDQTTDSMKNDSSLLRAVSPESDELPEKLRRVLPRQKGKGQTINSMKNDSSLLRAISPERDKSPEKLRRVSLRQKGKDQTTDSMKNDSSLLLAVFPERDKSSEKLRRVSPRQKGKGQTTNSMKNDRSLLHAAYPENCGESLEKKKTVSTRQKGSGRKTKTSKNYSSGASDKGYGGSSCEDDADLKGMKAADSGFLLARKRMSEDVAYESSDSSSDDFLVPTQSLDLNSDFFKTDKKELISDLIAVKNSVFPGINSLSESDDSDDLQNLKFIEIEKVASQPGLHKGNETVKNEYYSAESGSLKEKKNVNDINPRAVIRGNKTLTGKQQKISHKDKRHEIQQQDNAVVKSSHDKAEMEDSVHRDKTQVIGRKQLHKAKVETSNSDISKMDVSQLLALGEGLDPKALPKPLSITKRSNFSKQDVDSEEDGFSDWEEVDSSTSERQQIEHSIPKEGIAVTVKVPNMHQKRKKKGFDVAAYIKRRMNRIRRDIQVLMHKAHLLCWIAHGNYVNKILNSEILMGLSLSLIPSELCCSDQRRPIDHIYLQQIVQWFSKTVEVQENIADEEELMVSLQAQFEKKAANSRRDMVLMFVCVLRSLGINTRFVISLQPLSLKPPMSEILTLKNTYESKGKKFKQEQQRKADSGINKDSPNTSEDIRKKRDVVTEEDVVHSEEATTNKMDQAGKSNRKKCKENLIVAKKNIGLMPESVSNSGRYLRARKFAGKYVDNDCTTDSDEEMVRQEQESVEDLKTVNRNSTTSKKKIISTEDASATDTKGKKVRNTSTIAHTSGSGYTADIKIRPSKNGKGILDRRVLSSDSESDEAPVAYTVNKKKQQCDVWSEVFLESEKKWMCVDVYHQQIHCVREISSRASQPVHYVLAWQDDSTIRDVTRRYCPKWHNVTRKLRVDEEWWKESLKPFTGQRTARDDQEDEDLNRQLQDRPLPTSLAEYKNHPLYALKRDLLKFQAIYPPDAPTLGFVRGHPVYARECVHTLQSRVKWLREAKVVRLGETPYKIVKARPKWDRMSGKEIKDLPLEIFGPWQVDDYVPPTAVDGKVPRCEYGNVELYKPSMLPGGTVHMQSKFESSSQKIEYRLSPAIIGFGYTNGLWGPIYDGFVVCEEYKYVLAEAWQTEEKEAGRRYEEKRLKRIYGNWRRLIKGLFIRERLKARYNFEPIKVTTKAKTKKAKKFIESKGMKTANSDNSDWEMEQCD